MRRFGWIVFTAGLICLPAVAGEFYINLASQILVAAIFAASLNLLVGYGGLPSLGHASWVGLAAYVSAWMSLKLGLGHTITAPVALLATTLIACAFGWISLRATGLGFLMITLALSQVLWGTAYRWVSVTDGDNGLRGYPLRYQAGERRALLTIEERFYTELYPWRLFRVGWAAFLDVGRVSGNDPRASPPLGTLYDVGIGFIALLADVFVGGVLYSTMGMKRSVLVSLVLMAVSNLSFAALTAYGHTNLGMAAAIGFENFASGIGPARAISCSNVAPGTNSIAKNCNPRSAPTK